MTSHTIEQIHAAYDRAAGRELKTAGRFAVTGVARKNGKNGEFAIVSLSDPTGSLTALCFADGACDELLVIGAIDCHLAISTYQDKMSCKLGAFRKAELTDDEVLAFAGLDVDEHKARVEQIQQWVAELEGTEYLPVIEALLPAATWDQLLLAPGAVKMHHAEPGGLVKHLVEVGSVGLAMLGATGMAHDRAYFIAGLLLHDIGKLDTYSAPPTITYTAQGQMAEHQVFSMLRLGKALAQVDASPALEAKLVHIIEQAHGEHRHASWQDPIGIECKALACADQFSANLHPTERETQAQGLLDSLGA
jgi:23S rRNA maturation-related 3'-5' exoribonuclease YhaM